MDEFRFFMPVNTYFGRNCVEKNGGILKDIGKKAMVVTGYHSAKKNGAQADVVAALEKNNIAWILFDEIEENPSLETVTRASKIAIAEGVDFFIGIGGGSPMDAAKAISVMTSNPEETSDVLFRTETEKRLPVVAVSTTAGTGAEVTQFAVMTLHEKHTKTGMTAKVFPVAAFVDAKYMDTLPPTVTNNTAIDALSHLMESYLNKNANMFSEHLVELGFAEFKKCKQALIDKVYTPEIRDHLMMTSLLGGITIAQTGTSIPHLLGYVMTYDRHIPHGRVNAIVMQAYLEMFPEGDKKVARLLECLGFATPEELGDYFKKVLDEREVFTPEEVADFTARSMESPAKLSSFPHPVTYEDIYEVYRKSLLS